MTPEAVGRSRADFIGRRCNVERSEMDRIERKLLRAPSDTCLTLSCSPVNHRHDTAVETRDMDLTGRQNDGDCNEY